MAESDELRRARAESDRAREQLEQVQQNDATVDRVSSAVTKVIRRNGFGEAIEVAMRRRRTT